MNYLKAVVFIFLIQMALFGQTDTAADSALNRYLEQVRNIIINSDSGLRDSSSKIEVKDGSILKREIKILALDDYIKSLSINDLLSLVKKRERILELDLYKLEEYRKHNIYFNMDGVEGYYEKFGMFEGRIINRVKDLYGSAARDLIINPVLLKVKIIDKKSESKVVNETRSISQTNITAEIEDIVKGEKHYKTGDNINFYYMDFWARGSKTRLTENGSYFVTLFPVIDNNGDKLLGLNYNEGLLKISQDIVLDEKNYYGFGKIAWPDFKMKIIEKINIDKLMESASGN